MKLILWFAGHFFQYLMREGGTFFSVFKAYRNDAGGIFLTSQKYDTPTGIDIIGSPIARDK
jgi:hypothetical protein